jgi:hypothetical protein
VAIQSDSKLGDDGPSGMAGVLSSSASMGCKRACAIFGETV